MQFHKHPAMYIEHLHLKVANIEQSLNFYQDVLGFRVLEQKANQAQLSAGGMKSLITIEQFENSTPLNPTNTGLFHMAFLVPSRIDLAKVMRHLIDVRYPLQGASDHLVSEALYLADPDGNGIEIYADRDAREWNWQQGQVEMLTLPLNADDLLNEVVENGWEGMPEDTIIGHVHLQATELKKVEEIYTSGFGFDVVTQYGYQALFLSSENYHHHIGLNTWNSAGGSIPEANSIGLKSFTISIPETGRDQVAKRLINMGVSVSDNSDRYVVQDPSGNYIVF